MAHKNGTISLPSSIHVVAFVSSFLDMAGQKSGLDDVPKSPTSRVGNGVGGGFWLLVADGSVGGGVIVVVFGSSFWVSLSFICGVKRSWREIFLLLLIVTAAAAAETISLA